MHRQRCIFSYACCGSQQMGSSRELAPATLGAPRVAISAKKGERGFEAAQAKKSGMDWARDFEVMPFDCAAAAGRRRCWKR